MGSPCILIGYDIANVHISRSSVLFSCIYFQYMRLFRCVSSWFLQKTLTYSNMEGCFSCACKNELELCLNYGIMFAKGRVKWTENQMPSLLEQLVIRPFDERSDSSKSLILRSSARDLRLWRHDVFTAEPMSLKRCAY